MQLSQPELCFSVALPRCNRIKYRHCKLQRVWRGLVQRTHALRWKFMARGQHAAAFIGRPKTLATAEPLQNGFAGPFSIRVTRHKSVLRVVMACTGYSCIYLCLYRRVIEHDALRQPNSSAAAPHARMKRQKLHRETGPFLFTAPVVISKGLSLDSRIKRITLILLHRVGLDMRGWGRRRRVFAADARLLAAPPSLATYCAGSSGAGQGTRPGR